MKVDEIFKNCFSHDQIKRVLYISVMPDLKAGNVVFLDWENKEFRPSLVYCIADYLYQEPGVSGFKKGVKLENVPDGQKKLLSLFLNDIASMKD